MVTAGKRRRVPERLASSAPSVSKDPTAALFTALPPDHVGPGPTARHSKAAQAPGVKVACRTHGTGKEHCPARCPSEQPAVAQRAVTLRRELFDRSLIVNEYRLRQVLTEYLRHFNAARPSPGVLRLSHDVALVRHLPVLATHLHACRARRW